MACYVKIAQKQSEIYEYTSYHGLLHEMAFALPHCLFHFSFAPSYSYICFAFLSLVRQDVYFRLERIEMLRERLV